MSSSSDSGDIEIDGFPPELANNARFTSIKSNNDSITNQKIYLPITSWSPEILPAEIIKMCHRILKDSSSLPENERKQIMAQLESHMWSSTDSLNSETEWCSKSSVPYNRPYNVRNDGAKNPSVKVKIEIPSTSVNSNNIKYNVEKPVYDPDRHCWKTSMDFIFQNESLAISENPNEVFQDNKETQTDFELPKKKTSLPTIFKLESKCKSESTVIKNLRTEMTCSHSNERLAFCGNNKDEILSNPLNNDAEIAVILNFESRFESSNNFSSFNELFRKYKIIIRKTIEKYSREVKKLQTQVESINVQFYHKLTEIQFKVNSKNQLFLSDIEQELEFLSCRINLKNENVKKSDECGFEIQNCKFSETIRLILQMLSNVKNQIGSLNKELNLKNKTQYFNLK